MSPTMSVPATVNAKKNNIIKFMMSAEKLNLISNSQNIKVTKQV